MIGIMAALANKDVMAVLADKLFISKIMEVFKTAAAFGEDIAESRAELAERLARSAMEGDFDDVLRKVRKSDDAVADFIENG